MKSLVVTDDLVFLVDRHRGGKGGGPSLHVVVQTQKRPPQQETRRFQEIVHFDCFEQGPHYHVFSIDQETAHDLRRELDIATYVKWCLHVCAEELPEFAEQAGYPELMPLLANVVTLDHVATLRAWMLGQEVEASSPSS